MVSHDVFDKYALSLDASRPVFISLFSGCGGLDLGFASRGFRCLGSYDVNLHALSTLSSNLNSPVFRQDLAHGFSKPTDPREIDVVVAGPPCQGFSNIGSRDPNDPRNDLIHVAVEICLSLNPTIFVLENVPGALSGNHRVHWKSAEERLRLAGYHVLTEIVNVEGLGMSQVRKRAVLLATRVERPPLIQATLPPGTLRDAIGDIEPEGSNHVGHFIPLSPRQLAVAQRIAPGHRLSNVRGDAHAVRTWDIPEVYGSITSAEREVLEAIVRLRRRHRERLVGDADPVETITLSDYLCRDALADLRSLVNKGYVREKGRGFDLRATFNGKSRRLKWDAPSYTVDTKFGDPRLFLHPEKNRGFSVREAARVQGFPDWFVFEGPLREQFRMVGNAVPPPMAAFLADFAATLLREAT